MRLKFLLKKVQFCTGLYEFSLGILWMKIENRFCWKKKFNVSEKLNIFNESSRSGGNLTMCFFNKFRKSIIFLQNVNEFLKIFVEFFEFSIDFFLRNSRLFLLNSLSFLIKISSVFQQISIKFKTRS